jgi:uncharacterized damage-inducible protein DinB
MTTRKAKAKAKARARAKAKAKAKARAKAKAKARARAKAKARAKTKARCDVSLNPYAGALGEGDAVAVLAETPRRLEALVEGLSAGEIEAQPGPGKWSVREILAHLADCEIAFGFRLRQVYAGAQVMQPFDQDEWARAYASYPAGLALATFVALRDWNLAFIGGLSEAEKQRPGMHPERGEMVLWTIVETMAGHDLHHLKALEKLCG